MATQAVSVGSTAVGRVAREVRLIAGCRDSVRDVFVAASPVVDSAWLAWRDSLVASANGPARIVVDGQLLVASAGARTVVRRAASPTCEAPSALPVATWFAGVAWRGTTVAVAPSFSWYGGAATMRDSALARCAGSARLINGDGATTIVFGRCTFRALPPLITGLTSLDPAVPGGLTPQDQLRLVGLARVSGGADSRDTLVLRVEVTRTEGVARGSRDTAVLVLGRRAP